MTNAEAYAWCLKRERDRERQHRRHSRQGRFESEIASTDAILGSLDDPSKASILSDHGAGAERIVAHGEVAVQHSAWCLKRDNAARRLRRNGLGDLVNVFLLICKNGNNRKESIWQLTKKLQKTGKRRK